ncbi:MAG: bacterial Ig-like domain-containing protein [Clostridia bacterium]|nr:bacterial Ig-like domain-containing protein [Clostridia bacterium]
MMTVSKEILSHPDFTDNLALNLCKMLEALIDAEFEKGDGTDFNFIDECADAINAIRSGDTAQILPLISRKDFLGRLGIKNKRRLLPAVAACAAAALLFVAVTQLETEENVSIAQAFSGIVSELFSGRQQHETTKPHETTAPTRETADITGISVDITPEFKSEYFVGEAFSKKGLRVFAEYSNGERRLVGADGYSVEVSDSFGTQPKYETVKIKAGDFSHAIEVRVIESLSTDKLNSVYAVLPDNFSFTAEDLNSIDLGEMRVFAVYSSGREKELSKNEYSVEIEQKKTLFEKKATVTVKYENCSCSFSVSGE